MTTKVITISVHRRSGRREVIKIADNDCGIDTKAFGIYL